MRRFSVAKPPIGPYPKRAIFRPVTPLLDPARRLKAGKCLTLASARHEILMERDPLRELFWAAFDAFLPAERAARDGASSNQFLNNETFTRRIRGTFFRQRNNASQPPNLD